MPAKFRRLIRVPKKKTDKLKNRRCSILNATSQDQNLLENTLFYDKIAYMRTIRGWSGISNEMAPQF